MKKKIVWICHFANEEIRLKVNGKDNIFVAPWISDLIELFRNKEDIELSIISPNYFTNTNESFKLGKIQVYLFKYRLSFFPPKAYNLSINYKFSTSSILKIVDDIKPDIIHLHGSENPHYATSVISLIDNYPVLVTLQGFVSLSSVPKNPISRYIRWNRVRIEKIINSKAQYFTIANEQGLEELNKFNTKAKVYRDHYPTTKPDVSSSDFPNKKYDIVFYAKLSKNKGVEDLIAAVNILKKDHPSIKAIIIGGGSTEYTNYIEQLIESLGLVDNIILAGFQPTQQDVFYLAAQAKVYVLPSHFDGIPGSIREAMFMKIPVVANAVGGIPTFNSEKECIALVEKGNINDLVQKIQLVLSDENYAQHLVNNAYNLITDKYDNGKIYSNMINIYNNILQITTKSNNEESN
tara:strand:+ start:82223 stop:83443 length:1221 start_codon:yes stop_codon:yes gene_type:complete